jgi:hypothetical protein
LVTGREVDRVRAIGRRGFFIALRRASRAEGAEDDERVIRRVAELVPRRFPSRLRARTGELDELNPGIYVVWSDGSGRRLLVERGQSPSWAPDGSRLALDAGFAGDGLDVVDPAKRGSQVRVAESAGGQGGVIDSAAWSPDGSMLAFCDVPFDAPKDSNAGCVGIVAAVDPRRSRADLGRGCDLDRRRRRVEASSPVPVDLMQVSSGRACTWCPAGATTS